MTKHKWRTYEQAKAEGLFEKYEWGWVARRLYNNPKVHTSIENLSLFDLIFLNPNATLIKPIDQEPAPELDLKQQEEICAEER